MTERVRFVLAVDEGLYSITELCQRFRISRKTGYKWLQRYRQGGLEALAERSRASHRCPHRTHADVETLLVETRRAHPHWGARKVLVYLAARHRREDWPAPSTVTAIFHRHGLIQARPKRRKTRHPGSTPLVTSAPNQLWCADYKGEFRLGNGRYCYPLTVTDAETRYILACEALPSTGQALAFSVFGRLFEAYGLPEAMRTDNGTPFASVGLCGLSRLSLWWLQLGLDHQRIRPGRPQENGRHERMHRTLKAETTRPPEATMGAQQARFDAFREEFNTIRPHEALDWAVPAEHYRASRRPLPAEVAPPSYPGHYETRRVSKRGAIRFKGRRLFLSLPLARQEVGLEEEEDGVWSLYYYEVLLGRFAEADFKLIS